MERSAALLYCMFRAWGVGRPNKNFITLNLKLIQSILTSILKSRFTTAVRITALLSCCCSSGLVGGFWVGGGSTTWINCFLLGGG